MLSNQPGSLELSLFIVSHACSWLITWFLTLIIFQATISAHGSHNVQSACGKFWPHCHRTIYVCISWRGAVAQMCSTCFAWKQLCNFRKTKNNSALEPREILPVRIVKPTAPRLHKTHQLIFNGKFSWCRKIGNLSPINMHDIIPPVLNSGFSHSSPYPPS